MPKPMLNCHEFIHNLKFSGEASGFSRNESKIRKVVEERVDYTILWPHLYKFDF